MDAKSGTLDNAAGKVTTVASGATVNLNGITVNNAGIIDIDAGGAVNAVEQKNEDLGTDGVVTLGGTINVGGTLTVGGNTNPTSAGTTLVIAEDAVLTSDTEFSTAAPQKAIISVQGGNTLQVSAAQLQSFLASGNQVDLDGDGAQAATADKAGGVSLTGTIDFGDSVTLSGFTFGNTDEYAAGKIAVGGTTAVAKATNVTLNKALSGVTAANLTVEADNLDVNILTNSDRIALDGADWDLNFKSATVHSSLNLSAAGIDSVTLGNTYHLDAYTTSEDAKGNTVYTPASGSISGAAEVSGDGHLQVNAGSWVANDQITVGHVNSGNGILVNVGASNDTAAHQFEIGSSLTLAGGLVFDLASGNASVAASNNTDLSQDAPLSELDLTAGISVTNGGSNTASIQASSTNAQAIVYLNERDVNAILSSDTATNRNLNKVAILVEGKGGTLEVAGSVDANFIDFKSGTGTAGAISFKQGGNFVVDSLTLRGDSSTADDATAINIGTGSITADSVNLVDKVTPVTDDRGNDRTKVSITAGTLNVGSSLTSNAGTFTVSGAGSTLNLEAGADTDQGLITSLDQITLAGGNATVTAGNWLAQVTDFDVQDGSSLTIGGATNADGTYKHASLSANNLTVGATAKVEVNTNGAATFNTLDASVAGSSAIEVANGTLTINGQAGDMDGDAETIEHGLYFGDRNSTAAVFRVTGSAGKLVFGEQASLTFFDQSQQSGAATNESGVVTEALVDASAQDKLLVSDGGRVLMDFNGYSFTKDQVKDLKNKLFNGNFDRAGLLDGFFDIGDSTISGIDVVSGSISWDSLADITDIVWDTTNTELGSAVVTDVTESSQIGGSYGALRPDAGTTLVHLASNTALSNAAANGGLFIGTAPTTDAEGNVTPGTPVDAVVHEGSVFSVTGAGTLADVTLMGSSSNSDLTTFAARL